MVRGSIRANAFDQGYTNGYIQASLEMLRNLEQQMPVVVLGKDRPAHAPKIDPDFEVMGGPAPTQGQARVEDSVHDLGDGTLVTRHVDNFLVRWGTSTVVLTEAEIAELARFAGIPNAGLVRELHQAHERTDQLENDLVRERLQTGNVRALLRGTEGVVGVQRERIAALREALEAIAAGCGGKPVVVAATAIEADNGAMLRARP